jgi:uncharacterized protein (TIGR00369 family)
MSAAARLDVDPTEPTPGSVPDPERSRSYSWADPQELAATRGLGDGAGVLHAIVRGEVAPPPITHTLAYELTYVGDGEATFEIEPAEFHFNPLGTVHGGVISTVLDSALGCAVQTKLPAGVSYTTIDLNVTFVRPVTLATGRLSCPAEVVNVGRRVGTARARLEDADGKLYATGTATCLIFDLPS